MRALLLPITRSLILLIVLLGCYSLHGQELKAKVSINSSRLGAVDALQYEQMEQQLNELLNNTRFTSLEFAPTERIECSFALNLTAVEEGGKYSGELLVTAQRPVYNTNYQAPLMVWRDAQVNFEHQPFDPIVYTPDRIENNLVATVVFYAYTLIALDLDSFSPLGGDRVKNTLRDIAQQAAQVGTEWKGWGAFESDQNRYAIAEAFNQKESEPFRQFWYQYHRKGLDEMVANTQRGRTTIYEALATLLEYGQATPRSPLLILFSQSKLSEVVNILVKGSSEERNNAYKTLSKLYPTAGNTLDALKR